MSIGDDTLAPGTVDRWITQVRDDALTPKGDCFIEATLISPDNFESADFVPCTRSWPRTIKTVDCKKRSQAEDTFVSPPNSSKYRKKNITPKTTISEPQSKLRPAADVLKRLKHDPSLNIDEFVVGYLDRHEEKVQEKSASSWVRDTTDEEWIPEHRIVWFKRCPAQGESEIMWDKPKRLDKIFKESGSFEE